MKYSLSRHLAIPFLFGAFLASGAVSAADPHYTSPSENIKNFFSGTWEGSFQLGYLIPQSSTELKNTHDFAFGIYHDIGSNIATELQYFTSGDFDSTNPNGASASFQTKGLVASLRGYGKPGPLDLKYFGRMGVAFYEVDFDNGNNVIKDYDSGNTFVLGFGAEKSTNDKTTFSVEVTYFHDMVQSGYVNSINIGVRQALASW